MCTYQCNLRAWRKADSPSMINRINTVSVAKKAKMIDRAKNPPKFLEARPMCITIDHKTSESSGRKRNTFKETTCKQLIYFSTLHIERKNILTFVQGCNSWISITFSNHSWIEDGFYFYFYKNFNMLKLELSINKFLCISQAWNQFQNLLILPGFSWT